MAKKDDHWFKFYYRLIIISCQGWKDDEFGAYVKLLIHQFDKGGLPDNEAEIQKLITSFKKNWPLIKNKFKKSEDGLLRNDFMKNIREERDRISAANSENGKTGGRGNKKLPENENKANGLRNESKVLSSSLSSYPSLGVDGGSGEEEEVGVSPDGIYSDEVEKDIQLTEIEIGATQQYIQVTTKKIIDRKEIVDRWEAFKIKQFSLHEHYNGWNKLINHFRDSLKLDLKNGKEPKSSAGKNLHFDRP